MEQTATSVTTDPETNGRSTRWRNWSGFWLLGLCNNFAYVVMLSAAHDILKKQSSENNTASASASLTVDFQSGNSSNSSRYDCNPVSTAAVLLADILPTLVIKLFAPFVVHKMPYGVRVLFCAVMAATSFLLVSFSSAVLMSILGVIFASVSSGLGELSFLSLTVFFSRDVLGGWGSGTGGAGVAGAFIYSGLTQVGVSPQITLLIMLVVPVAMLISYFFLLDPPPSVPQWRSRETEYAAVGSEEDEQLIDGSEEEEKSTTEERTTRPLTFTEKLHVIRGLLKFVFPLGLVYFAEYFINQGLMELLYFPDFFLSHAEQYRWYQTLYQVGVLVSRSSLCCVKIRKVWALSLLQVRNRQRGQIRGGKSEGAKQREFAMAAASVGDSLGIALAGLAAFPVHRYFCSL
ncbi:battenin [Labrus mixtus]|uniref:battenin n=1 Tax=Labrus mixtus TaxID=508554 RepID=UPI0029BFC799|nr:battenin [Labrus mixtus]